MAKVKGVWTFSKSPSVSTKIISQDVTFTSGGKIFMRMSNEDSAHEPVIDLDIASYSGGSTITNVGTLGSYANATVATSRGSASYSNTSTNPGILLKNGANFTVPTDLISNASDSVYTWIVKIGAYSLNSSATYDRICRGDQDVPSIYYYRSSGKFCAKLAGRCNDTSVLSYNSSLVTDDETYGYIFSLSAGDVLAFTCDGTTIRFYINGVEAISMLSSGMTDTATTTIGCGDTSNTSSYYFNSLTICKFLLYSRCLSAEELGEVT